FYNGIDQLIRDKKYRLPRVDPIKVPEMKIRVGNALAMDMKQVRISGIGDSDVNKVDFDFDNNRISTAFFVPNLNIQSRYVISGSILTLPIEGRGSVNITMSRVNFTYDFDFDVVENEGLQYIQPLNPSVAFKSAGGYVDFGDLLSADSTYGKQVNQFLNDNWEEAEDELRGDIAPAIAAIITSLAQQYLSKFSMTDMFLP
ncbi:hypothetical protein Trydic_g3650, partial [Trypoxylus dichotomus]